MSDPAGGMSSRGAKLRGAVALVVGSMVGAGIFTLPAAWADTGALGAFVAWCIAGVGMLMLARLPGRCRGVSLSSTPASTPAAKAGFGDHLGYLAAFGYWMVLLPGLAWS